MHTARHLEAGLAQSAKQRIQHCVLACLFWTDEALVSVSVHTRSGLKTEDDH